MKCNLILSSESETYTFFQVTSFLSSAVPQRIQADREMAGGKIRPITHLQTYSYWIILTKNKPHSVWLLWQTLWSCEPKPPAFSLIPEKFLANSLGILFYWETQDLAVFILMWVGFLLVENLICFIVQKTLMDAFRWTQIQKACLNVTPFQTDCTA